MYTNINLKGYTTLPSFYYNTVSNRSGMFSMVGKYAIRITRFYSSITIRYLEMLVGKFSCKFFFEIQFIYSAELKFFHAVSSKLLSETSIINVQNKRK